MKNAIYGSNIMILDLKSILTLTMSLTMNFQGQIVALLHLRKKWLDGQGMKNEHIDWMLGFKRINFDLSHDIDLLLIMSWTGCISEMGEQIAMKEDQIHQLNARHQIYNI